ncbi:hypothetical protein ACROYT_G025638 [Oculina patagonica]
MPQSISSAPEEYQEGLNGVKVIAGDILCYGSGETIEDALADHDSNLLSLLDRARKVNLKLREEEEAQVGRTKELSASRVSPPPDSSNPEANPQHREDKCSRKSQQEEAQLHTSPQVHDETVEPRQESTSPTMEPLNSSLPRSRS